MDTLGIHLTSSVVQIALLRKKRGKLEIYSLQEATYPNVKQLYICDFKGRTISGMHTNDFFIRPMEVKIGAGRHTEEALAFQGAAISHFNPTDILCVPLIQKTDKQTTNALLFTVPREAIQKHLAALESIGVDPDQVSTVPSALQQFIRWKFPDCLDAFIIDIGASETSCVLIEQGQLKKTHAIQGGIDKLLASLLEDRKKVLLKKEIEGAAKQIDLLLLKAGLNPHLTNSLNELRQELAKAMHSFCREGRKEIIFTGNTDAFIHLPEFLVFGIDPNEGGKHKLTSEEKKFAISIGLALSSPSFNLRREEFFPQKNWRRMGFYALLLLGFSTLLSGACVALGLHSSSVRKKEMCQQQNLADPSQIDDWIFSIENNNKEYPYILQTPKAADVLAWLSSHPLLQEMRQAGDPIDIREVRYKLINWPKIDAPKEPHLAQIELEFQFKNAMNARKFHDALRKGDHLINPNLEITWQALHEGYRASAYLKNRSPHVL